MKEESTVEKPNDNNPPQPLTQSIEDKPKEKVVKAGKEKKSKGKEALKIAREERSKTGKGESPYLRQ